jgi:CO/xanthine dehydrogenase Mo-binding subunit
MGNAVLGACRDIQAQVRAMAARLEGLPEDDVLVDRGMVALPVGAKPIIDIVRAGLGKLGGELIGNGMYRKDAQPDHPLGGSPAFYEFNCTAVEPSVDEETGHITIHDHVIVGDTGTSLHPGQVAGQDEGAAIMGLGHTLMEHIILDESGRIRNLGAIDYRIPTSMDLPQHMVSAAVENADGPGPYGSKGISEGGLLAVQSAVGSAVADATGVVIRELPLTPERVWRSIRDARRAQPMSEEGTA